MALNLCVDTVATTTVNITPDLDTYIINAAASTTYNYNLPTVSCDGMTITLIRIDSTSGIVNLVGTIYLNGGTVSSYTITNQTTTNVISLGGIWYLIYSTTNSIVGKNNIFSAYFIGNNGNDFISISPTTTFLVFPFLGTNTGISISNIVFTYSGSLQGTIRTYRLDAPSGTLFTISFTGSIAGTNHETYTLTAADKSTLPASTVYLGLVITNINVTNINICSVIFYA